MEDSEVPTEHLHEEIHHRAEQGGERWMLGVALSSALLASLAAVASLQAGHSSHEAMISQIESANQWSYFQSKSIKEAKHHLRSHQVLSRSVTMFQIAIAIGAISVLMRRRRFWLVSIAFGLAGIFFVLHALLAIVAH